MRFAYADPPYLGTAHLYPERREVDHATLIAQLVDEYPDGWALSCHSPSLRVLLPMCPDDVRVMAFAKTFVSFRPNGLTAYAWEPVLVRGGRKRAPHQPTPFDWVSCAAVMGFLGAKPDKFSTWLFTVLNMQPGDEFDDLFPGSGAVTRAWDMWQRQMRLPV